MTIQIWDETIPGKRSQATVIHLDAQLLTLRELIRTRVRQEVEIYNQSLPETFQGLVQPEQSEQILNGFHLKVRRPLDWEAQFRQACSSFERNGFLILVDDEQVTDLDTKIRLHKDTQVNFVKLVPLVGG
jgi:hypothetical protein